MADDQMNVAQSSETSITDGGDSGIDDVDAHGARGVQGGSGAGDSGAQFSMRASDFYAECYNMDHSRRGKAIIFNNKVFDQSTGMGERTGTNIDAENLFMILTEIGFEVVIENDCTAVQMESALVKAAREDHSDADCFACAILSHGEEGYVYGKDGPIQIDRLIAPFKGNKCQSLAGKPKIFFIQACRGNQLDDGADVMDSKGQAVEDMEIDSVEVRRIPTEADFLMAYSVVPGFYAWRNSAKGSWFIQALVDVLRENWRRMDLLTMMTKVCRKVAYDFESNASRAFMNRKKQIPCITSMLTRDVYFKPKK